MIRLSRTLFAVLLGISVGAMCAGQQQAQPSAPAREWTPQAIEALRQKAPSKTEFNLDHSMLILASKLDPDNEDLRRVIAGVNGVSVHIFKFAGPAAYDPANLNSLKGEYSAAGWKQLMNNEKIADQGVTSLWMRMENNAISNVAVLMVKSAEVDFVTVSGSISPLDLSHLGGHFGIPKIEGGVMVPNTSRRP